MEVIEKERGPNLVKQRKTHDSDSGRVGGDSDLSRHIQPRQT
jgi:hypothetical protein